MGERIWCNYIIIGDILIFGEGVQKHKTLLVPHWHLSPTSNIISIQASQVSSANGDHTDEEQLNSLVCSAEWWTQKLCMCVCH